MNFDELRSGKKAAMARALAQVERAPDARETLDLLNRAYQEPKAHVIGITGPPGVGKSTLTNALISHWRSLGRTVGVIAVDPSSRRTGGALLGDRTRFTTDPEDQGIYVRSMAARDRLGGLAGLTVSGMVLMRAVYDIVLIETVGVGQSETDIVGVADSVLFCVQPGSGDSLQFIKAGIVEIPHIVAVTKADMGAPARRAMSDMKGALNLAGRMGADPWDIPVLLLSSMHKQGIDELVETFDTHVAFLKDNSFLNPARHTQAKQWLEEAVREKFGRVGMQRVMDHLDISPTASPFERLFAISEEFQMLYKS
ncbi:methylmalonyl Co-A mutase-associated GTPase MeaB [Terasakiella sp. A23]|uniref:ArgK/MeaB family GTPase n=1 Tax=Terasakiella sp. FCG-A23 TaxID=3080561 RepID=UPI00295384BD|nr:methylmalonyl Co-A mutase-associated GTPase MeaB [Terasakiella sp. A23]MDV7339198.1 methylmalonyl Co-A mutase-associated GTPase MeaB [Terasakiella sp. A23]